MLISQVDYNALSTTYTPTLTALGVGGTISLLLTLFFPIAGFILLGMLMANGITYMTSQGDPKLIAKAQSGITYALIGFFIIFAAYMITTFFGYTLQISQIIDTFRK